MLYSMALLNQNGFLGDIPLAVISEIILSKGVSILLHQSMNFFHKTKPSGVIIVVNVIRLSKKIVLSSINGAVQSVAMESVLS